MNIIPKSDNQTLQEMKNLEIITEGKNHTAIDIGEFDNFMDYAYLHPKLNQEDKGS